MGNEVGGQHEGRIPLHGRLFAQWMHHAYPRECPYPHQAGTTRPMTTYEWMEERGAVPVAQDRTMEHWTTDPPTADGQPISIAHETGSLLMWSHDEELVATTTRPPTSALITLWGLLRNLALLGALVGLGLKTQQILASVL